MKTNLQNNKHKIKSVGALPEGDPILKRNTQRGITLVALIITVIVLLILAMVSIRLLMNGGIIDKAEKGTVAYSEAEVQEQIKLAYSEWQTAVWDGTSGDAAAFITTSLQQKYGTEKVANDAVTVSNGKITATIDGKTYEYNTATGKSGEYQPQTLSIITKDNYGDYIDLGQSVVGTSATTDDWRILYNDKDNLYGGTDGSRVYAILADYLPNENLAVKESNLSKVTGKIYNVNSTSRQNLFNQLNNTDAWKVLIPTSLSNNGATVKGGPTVEIIMASYNEKYGTSIAYTSTPYLITDQNDSSSSIDNLYMPHPGVDYSGCCGYWLASTYDADNNFEWIVNRLGKVYSVGYGNQYVGVCPVVSLPSNLQVTKNGNVWTVVQ